MFDRRLLSHSCALIALAITVTVLVSGCGQSHSDKAGSDSAMLDELFADLDLPAEEITPAAEDASDHSNTTDQSAAVAESTEAATDSIAAAGSSTRSATMSMSPSAQFPVHSISQTREVTPASRLPSPGERLNLIKTVEQTLYHKSQVTPFTMKTRLELTIQIEVEQVHDQAALLRLTYTHARYSREGVGQPVRFDSGQPGGSIPQEAVPYAGLAGNGFAFWINQGHTIGDVVGFAEFVQQCTANLPETYRQTVADSMTVQGAEVAGFVDQTVGLLPRRRAPAGSSELEAGDTWVDNRPIASATPVNMISTCKVTAATRKAISVEVMGRVLPQVTSSAVRHQPSVRVLDGTSKTLCSIDRVFGLPTRLDRHVTMSMMTVATNGEHVPQEKHVHTTITQLSHPARPIVNASPGLQPASELSPPHPVIQQTAAQQTPQGWR